MIRILSALLLAGAATLSHAAEPASPLVNNPPQQHIVVPGDTLWDISAKFLREPWRWPEIWRMNSAQIKNPHRIYPGDRIVLERDADGREAGLHIGDEPGFAALQVRRAGRIDRQAVRGVRSADRGVVAKRPQGHLIQRGLVAEPIGIERLEARDQGVGLARRHS